MITHPDYLCYRSLFSSNLKSGAGNYCARLGWLGTDDHDVQTVSDCGIIKERWHGSLLVYRELCAHEGYPRGARVPPYPGVEQLRRAMAGVLEKLRREEEGLMGRE